MEHQRPATANEQIPALTLSVRHEGATGVVVLGGELVFENRADLSQAIDQLVEGGTTTIQLDIGALTFIDSAGLAELLAIEKLTGQVGVALTIGPVSALVRRVVELAGLTEILLPGIGPPTGAPPA